jgi:hypothetical protein
VTDANPLNVPLGDGARQAWEPEPLPVEIPGPPAEPAATV